MRFPPFHLRKDPVVDRWVVVSAERSKRPGQNAAIDRPAQDGPCPFCRGNEAVTPPEILAYRPAGSDSDTPGWTVRVVPNKFPALARTGEPKRCSDGFFEHVNGVGAHEVIVETPDHVTDMSRLSEWNLEQVLRVYRDRILDLARDPKLVYILIFKNQGFQAGATMDHAHSQLLALPVVPREAAEEINGAQAYFEAKRHCVYCDMAQREAAEGVRIVNETEQFLILCPFASRFPFEIWFLPKRHTSRFEGATDEQLSDLSRALKNALERLNRVSSGPPFNYFIHSIPLNAADDPALHWHIELIPRLTPIAGFEWGSGFTINAVSPEESARLLRESRA